MAKKLVIDFGDLETWVNNVASDTAEESVERIVRQLKVRGPYWTGEFEDAWKVTLGKPIPATREPDPALGTQKQRILNGPKSPQITPLKAGVDFPSAPKQSVINYTIGNEMVYRDVAQDLIPGRIKGGGNETANQNWYEEYIQAGGLATTIALAANRVSKDPQIKNFKGKLSK